MTKAVQWTEHRKLLNHKEMISLSLKREVIPPVLEEHPLIMKVMESHSLQFLWAELIIFRVYSQC